MDEFAAWGRLTGCLSPVSTWLPPELFDLRDLCSPRHGTATAGGKANCESRLGLFADKNKDASGQRYDVEKKDGRADIQAEP
jgi:hypothetical protein